MTLIVNLESLKNDKKEKVLDASLTLFIRYGFRRTTMGDIAEEAEMSRPAVYLLYPNKEEIFRAVIIRYFERSLLMGQKRVGAADSLEGKIRAVLETWVIDPYKIICLSPQAEELYESTYSFTSDLRQRVLQLYETQLTQVLDESPEVDPVALTRLGLGPERLARLLARGTMDLKRWVTDLTELETLLDTAVRMQLAVLTGTR